MGRRTEKWSLSSRPGNGKIAKTDLWGRDREWARLLLFIAKKKQVETVLPAGSRSKRSLPCGDGLRLPVRVCRMESIFLFVGS